MNQKYLFKLTAEERQKLEQLLSYEPSNMPTFCSNRIAVRLAPIGPIAKSANRLMWLH